MPSALKMPRAASTTPRYCTRLAGVWGGEGEEGEGRREGSKAATLEGGHGK